MGRNPPLRICCDGGIVTISFLRAPSVLSLSKDRTAPPQGGRSDGRADFRQPVDIEIRYRGAVRREPSSRFAEKSPQRRGLGYQKLKVMAIGIVSLIAALDQEAVPARD